MGKTLLLRIVNPELRTEDKLRIALKVLSKASGRHIQFDDDESKSEATPYVALQEHAVEAYQSVSTRLWNLYTAILSKWLHSDLEKAEDKFRLNGKLYINPKTKKYLTRKEWELLQRDLKRIFTWLYGDTENALLKRAMALGMLLQEMNPDDRLNVHKPDVKLDSALKAITADQRFKHVVDYGSMHTGELIQDVTERSRKRIAETIMQGYSDQVTQRELEDRLFEDFSTLNRDWRRIAETETAINFNNGYALGELKENAEDEKPIFMQGISGGGACQFCASQVNNKIVVLLPEPPADGTDTVVIENESYTAIWPGKNNFGRKRANWWVGMTIHPHCILPGQLVSSALPSSIFKGFYKGRVIEFTFANGRKITVTENHPVLTADGFIAAKFVREGFNIIGSTDPDRIMQSVNPDYYQRESFIEYLYGAAKHSSGVPAATMPASPEDFHGDGVSFHEQVDVVNAYGLLGRDVEAAMFQHRNQPVFRFVDYGGLFVVGSTLLQSVSGYDTTANGVMSFLDVKFSNLRGRDGHSGIHSITTIPWDNPGFDETLVEGGTTHTEFSREFLSRFTGDISVDDDRIKGGKLTPWLVTHINSFDYAGDVYDLTDDIYGLYTCNGVVVKNCRCTFVRTGDMTNPFVKKMREAMIAGS